MAQVDQHGASVVRKLCEGSSMDEAPCSSDIQPDVLRQLLTDGALATLACQLVYFLVAAACQRLACWPSLTLRDQTEWKIRASTAVLMLPLVAGCLVSFASENLAVDLACSSSPFLTRVAAFLLGYTVSDLLCMWRHGKFAEQPEFVGHHIVTIYLTINFWSRAYGAFPGRNLLFSEARFKLDTEPSQFSS